jgi:hypothetical protein
VESVAAILVLMIVLANIVAYLNGGRAGVGKWWHAKLVGG